MLGCNPHFLLLCCLSIKGEERVEWTNTLLTSMFCWLSFRWVCIAAGVTIMALGALAANPSLDLKIVCCGLNYFHPHRFRSRAVVEFSDPLTVPPELIEQYKKGGPDKREACGKLLDIIYDTLKSVTLNAPDYETLMVRKNNL